MTDERLGSRIAPIVRDATDTDVGAIREIYAHHVANGLGTFEEKAPTVDEMRARYAAAVAAGMPYLVATLEERVVGYSYVTAYRPRPAYRYTVEDSVYIANAERGRGIGSALMSSLITRCEAGPWRQMVAVIGDSANSGSISLHEKFGFHHVGTIQAVGYKFDRWVDTVIMQRELNDGSRTKPSHVSD